MTASMRRGVERLSKLRGQNINKGEKMEVSEYKNGLVEVFNRAQSEGEKRGTTMTFVWDFYEDQFSGKDIFSLLEGMSDEEILEIKSECGIEKIFRNVSVQAFRNLLWNLSGKETPQEIVDMGHYLERAYTFSARKFGNKKDIQEEFVRQLISFGVGEKDRKLLEEFATGRWDDIINTRHLGRNGDMAKIFLEALNNKKRGKL
jgi:hypothetical protein